MKLPHRVLIAFSVALIVTFAGWSQAQRFGLWSSTVDDSKYRVFCANGKIEVEQRTLEQEKNARGSSVCVLGEFEYLSDADKEAEKRGGKGSECKCE